MSADASGYFDAVSADPPTGRPWGINFGGGLNSTALILAAFERGHRPDWIAFADTGGEKPETYEHVHRMQEWLEDHGWPGIDTVRWERVRPLDDGRTWESLEDRCIRTGYMPSAAYGYAGCSAKYKRQPMAKWRKARGLATSVVAIGFDAGEHRRVKRRRCQQTLDNPGEAFWYPLYAWGIDRQGCADLATRHGFCFVPKSSCFFCPHMTRHEWLLLKQRRPDLFARACAIEARAEAAGNTQAGGLMRSAGHIRSLDKQGAMFPEPEPDRIACDCFELGLGDSDGDAP